MKIIFRILIICYATCVTFLAGYQFGRVPESNVPMVPVDLGTKVKSTDVVKVGDRYIKREDDPFNPGCYEYTILDIRDGYAQYSWRTWDEQNGRNGDKSITRGSGRILGFKEGVYGRKAKSDTDSCDSDEASRR